MATIEEDFLHKGSCHCGAIQFQVWAPKTPIIIKCNCSVCEKKQNLHFIVPGNKFALTSGKDKLTTYTFNTHQAKHTFCSICGVQSFYYPRSNPDGVGIMPHCIDGGTLSLESKHCEFDGKNWEREMEEKTFIVELSKSK